MLGFPEGKRRHSNRTKSPQVRIIIMWGGRGERGGGGGLVMYLIRRYHVVNNNYSRSLFRYSHSFFWMRVSGFKGGANGVISRLRPY
jgi:hypothetical protein